MIDADIATILDLAHELAPFNDGTPSFSLEFDGSRWTAKVVHAGWRWSASGDGATKSISVLRAGMISKLEERHASLGARLKRAVDGVGRALRVVK